MGVLPETAVTVLSVIVEFTQVVILDAEYVNPEGDVQVEIEKLSMEIPLSAPVASDVTHEIPNDWPFVIVNPVSVKVATLVVATVPLVPVFDPVKSFAFKVTFPAKTPVPLQSQPDVLEYLHCS